MTMNVIEMNAFLQGKCLPSDIKVNETIAEYLVRKLQEAKGKTEAMSKAAADVLAERSRQVTAEGWTYEHDDEHATGELAMAAAGYLENYARAPWVSLDIPGKTLEWKDSPMPAVWPWGSAWWKPSSPRRDLVKASALILAEIEKGDREYEASKEDA